MSGFTPTPRTEALTALGFAFLHIGVLGCQAPHDGPAFEEGRTLDLRASVAWAVGGLEELGGVVFESQPASAAFGPSGAVAAADRLGSQVLMLSAEGHLLRSVGRSGAGPGEFQGPVRVGFTGDSLLWVVDAQLSRISWFDLAGALVETRSLPGEAVPSSPWTAFGRWVLDGGRVLGYPSGPSSEERGEPPVPMPLVVWDRGEAMHVIGWVERRAPGSLRIPLASGFFVSSEQPIQGFPILGTAPRGQWFFVLQRDGVVDRNGRGMIVITRYTSSGTQVDRVEIPYEAQPTDDETLRNLRTRADFHAEQIRSRGRAVRGEDIFDGYWIPSHLPAVRAVLADEEGYWLQREAVFPGKWERYDLGGELCATATLPPGFQGLAGTSDRLVGIRTDSLGVHSLLAYHLGGQS